jgi:hypothetical protein
MVGLNHMMRTPCCALTSIEKGRFLETRDHPLQCAEGAANCECGKQPSKFAVIGHDAGFHGAIAGTDLILL